MKGYIVLMKSPQLHTENSGVPSDILAYLLRATCSSSHHHCVAVVLNLDNSGWQTDMIRLIDGIAGSVRQTAFNLEAVTLPALILYQSFDPDCPLVAFSVVTACCGLTVISISSDSCKSS